jgi:nitronate monooxygenase
VSGPDLVIAACKAGVIGAFPAANTRTDEEFDSWLSRIAGALRPEDAPLCPNLIIRRETLAADLATVIRHRCELVITSVGPPDVVVGPLHEIGCMVFADVASIRHARKAIAAGVDGLVLLTAGAGGQTGWVNGFSFVRAVRAFWDGPIVLAGGISDGQAVFAAEMLGCNLSYMGTKFIATDESMAVNDYKAMLVASELDDILLSRAFTGLETNTLIPSIVAAGLDPRHLPSDMTKESADALYGRQGSSTVKRWRDTWSAGHSVSGVEAIRPVADLVARIRAEYAAAQQAARRLLGESAR